MPLEQLKSPEDLERFLLDNEGIAPHDLVPLPSPYEDWKDDPIPELSEDQRKRYEAKTRAQKEREEFLSQSYLEQKGISSRVRELEQTKFREACLGR